MAQKVKEYDLITIDILSLFAEAFISSVNSENLESGSKYKIDFNFSPHRRNIIKEIGTHRDCALYYQMRQCIGVEEDLDDRGVLMNQLIIADFTRLYCTEKSTAAEKLCVDDKDKSLRELFTEGMSIRFNGSDDFLTFVPFDRSNSMSRNYQMTFVNKNLITSDDPLKNIEKRLSLEMDFNESKVSIIPTKYSAYRGLSLTSGYRIDQNEDFCFNEETVLVLGEEYIKTSMHNNIHTINAKIFKDEGGKIVKDDGANPKEFQTTHFDGEGLISPKYAAFINEQLDSSGGKQATSFQIRMPFTKGMLHEVDFHGFMQEGVIKNILCYENYEDVEIIDYFEIPRKLSKAQIIMPASMFKLKDELKKYCDEHEEKDQMKFFFNQLRKFDHTLYISKTDLNFASTDRVNLNYQFLNPLDMDRNEFSALVEEQVKFAVNILNDDKEARKRMLNLTVDSDVETEDEESFETPGHDSNYISWQAALDKNIEFANDNFIREKIKATGEAELKKIITGRIETKGVQRFLSDDLFCFLIYLAVCTINLKDKEIIKDNSEYQELNSLRDKAMIYDYRAYIPEWKPLKLHSRQCYGMLRNPHLSRNEEVLIYPFVPTAKSLKLAEDSNGEPVDFYTKYLSHLSGVVMISYRSDVAATLGGADFDGDLVKIIDNKAVNNAIARGAYRRGDKYYTRELPIAVIPNITSSSGVPAVFGTKDYYKNMCDEATGNFSNKIGQISNQAIAIAREEYFGTEDEKADPQIKNKCATCTIITGLEIDAVKTGIHPDFEAWLSTEGKKDAYINRKDILSEIKYLGKRYKNSPEYKKNFKEDYAKIFEENLSEKNYHILNIDILPYRYIDEKIKPRGGEKKAHKKIYDCKLYNFEISDPDWAEKIETEAGDKIDKFRKIVATYRAFATDRRKAEDARKKLKHETTQNLMCNILIQDYAAPGVPGSIHGYDITRAIAETCEQIRHIFPDIPSVEKALKKLEEEYWELCDRKEKEKILKDCFNIRFHNDPKDDSKNEITEVVEEVLLNPSQNGSRLLLYAILDLKLKYSYEEKLKMNRNTSRLDGKLYNSLKEKYLSSVYNEISTAVFWEEVQKCCKEQVKIIFEEDMDYALKCAHYLRTKAKRKCGSDGEFFWNFFDKEIIKRNMIVEESKNA